MKKPIILLILVLSICQAYGQNSIVTDIDCGCGKNGQYQTFVDSLSQLPTKFQFIVNSWFEQSMTDFTGNIKFVKGVNYDLENWLGNDSITQSRIRDAVPKYQLVYQLSDPELKIKAFCIKIELDSYGQVTDFGWPRENYNKREKFVKPTAALELALKQCKIKKLKTDKYYFMLRFDPELKRLYWHISFVQKTTGDKWSGSEDYIEMHIDATELKIIEEKDGGIDWMTRE
ncbi:MAG: hypothetical protein WCR42_12365 [bacterium]